MSNAPIPPTTMDVLEGFFGKTPTGEDVRKLSRAEIENLGDRVREFSSAAEAEPAPEGTMYPGGWVAGHWMWEPFFEDLNLALLYYPNVLVHDPLTEYFFDQHEWIPSLRPLSAATAWASFTGGPEIWVGNNFWIKQRGNFDMARENLAALIARYVDFEPLVRAGIMVPKSQWPTVLKSKQALMTSVRHDVRSDEMQAVVVAAEEAGDPLPLWDNLRGMRVVPSGGWRKQDAQWAPQYEFFHGAKNLAVAADSQAQFIPQNNQELALLRAKTKTTLPTAPGQNVLQEVAKLLVPAGITDPKTAVAIRKNDGDYEDWRKLLRNLERNSAGATPAEVAERVKDELGPMARRLENSATIRARSTKAAKDATSAFVFSIPGALAGSLVTGGNPSGGIVGGVATGAVSWLYNTLSPDSLQGTDTVIASLMRANKG